MKKINRTILLAVCGLMAATACQKGDGDADYGNALIYIPQATQSALIDNFYNVPSGDAENTYNFKLDDGKINVLMGVVRSGKLSGSAFSVKVNVLEDKTASAAAELGAEQLPSSLYTLPKSVSVEAGKNAASFSLSLDKAGLGVYSGKKLVLVVGISDPTAYELAKVATEVTVVVDVDALLALV